MEERNYMREIGKTIMKGVVQLYQQYVSHSVNNITLQFNSFKKRIREFPDWQHCEQWTNKLHILTNVGPWDNRNILKDPFKWNDISVLNWTRLGAISRTYNSHYYLKGQRKLFPDVTTTRESDTLRTDTLHYGALHFQSYFNSISVSFTTLNYNCFSNKIPC